MERWQNKVAVVTGASSGIGAQVAEDLLKAGFIVFALARRELRLVRNQEALPVRLQDRYHPSKCDITDEEQVRIIFGWIEEDFGGVDVLINNAGVGHDGIDLSALGNTRTIKEVVDTNVMGVVYCVRAAFNSMKRRNFGGHIVVVNSVVGHYVPSSLGFSMNIYPATKHAVTAMVETYRQEFASAGTKVKITSISPGAVETEGFPDLESYKNAGNPILNVLDVSNAILYVLSTPPHVQVHELIIRPVGEKL